MLNQQNNRCEKGLSKLRSYDDSMASHLQYPRWCTEEVARTAEQHVYAR
jgi:hypothetical protein